MQNFFKKNVQIFRDGTTSLSNALQKILFKEDDNKISAVEWFFLLTILFFLGLFQK
jgi:hypothetical protein